MSNEIQKLKPVERSLYRRVFMARIEGGQSPEAAHRHGLNAVKMWNEVGAFNEERETNADALIEKRATDALWALQALFMDADKDLNDDADRISDAIHMLLTGGINVAEFRFRLGLSPASVAPPG